MANVGCGAKPHGVSKTLEGRAVGDNVPKAHHKQPLGIYAKRRAIRAQQGFQRFDKNPPKKLKTAKNTQNYGTKYRYRRRRKKTQVNQQVAIDNVITNDNNVTNIDNIGNVMNRHMQQIDSETGEVVDGFVAYVVPKRKNGFQRGWMAMAQDAMMMLAQSNLTGNDMKVMWAMLARLDYENLIQVSQAEVAQELGMNRHNVNRSIKKLIELGVVLEGVRIGISRSYRLNPNFGWKGSARGHREALADHLKLVK